MWQPRKVHHDLLSELLKGLSLDAGAAVLDAGSGRTSLWFLTRTYPGSRITALVHPRDERKKAGIRESIGTGGFQLVEADILEYRATSPFDLVLAHLLLGEAEKFGAGAVPVLSALFALPSRYLAIVDILEDPAVDYRALLREAAATTVRHLAIRGEYVGILVEKGAR